jgi:hypothetical protein
VSAPPGRHSCGGEATGARGNDAQTRALALVGHNRPDDRRLGGGRIGVRLGLVRGAEGARTGRSRRIRRSHGAGVPETGYAYQCWFDESFYVRSAAWSPDDSTIYPGTTGFQPWNWESSRPRTGLCDSTSAFGEHQLFRIPQVSLAVDGQHPVPADQGSAVVDQPVLAQLAEPARNGGGVPHG